MTLLCVPWEQHSHCKYYQGCAHVWDRTKLCIIAAGAAPARLSHSSKAVAARSQLLEM